MHDVIIIGGGVMGLTSAWELAKTGASVCLLEKSQPGGEASWAGAGILPPGHRGSPEDPLAPLLRRATELWPNVSAELKDATGIDNGFRNCGEIQILESPTSMPADMAAWNVNGVRTEKLTSDQLHDLEPSISRELTTAYLLPDACQVRNPWHVRALQEACRIRGVQILDSHEVTSFSANGGRMESVETAAGRHSAGAFLVTGGAWTAKILAEAGVAIELEPVRGQIVLLRSERPLFRRILEIGSRYLVPRDDGRVIIGSTEEWVGFVKDNTAEGVAGLLEFARRLVPDLSKSSLERCWSGLRPHTKRGLPYIGQAPQVSNLFVAAGHFRAGLHLSTITGRLAAQLIRGESPELPLASFAIQ